MIKLYNPFDNRVRATEDYDLTESRPLAKTLLGDKNYRSDAPVVLSPPVEPQVDTGATTEDAEIIDRLFGAPERRIINPVLWSSIITKGGWPSDIHRMHEKFGVREAVEKLDGAGLQALLTFRYNFLAEEMAELRAAMLEKNSEETVDALIDLCVVAIGTLDMFGVDTDRAWDEVLDANMKKEVGIKETRPNPLGLPDLVKPEGWEGPDHRGNHGKLTEL